MSDETQEALETAVAAHFLDAYGGHVTGYVLVACGVSIDTLEDGTDPLMFETGDQPVITTLGLAKYLEHEVASFYRDSVSDD